MSENLTIPEESPKELSKPTELAKIDVERSNSNPKDNENNELLRVEESLLACTRILLRQYGLRKSGAAVRDAVELPHNYFKAQQAVSALSSLGFKASFGGMRIEKISSDFLPVIAFLKDGSAVVLKEKLDDAFIIGAQGKIKSAFGTFLPTFPDAGNSGTINPGSTFPNKSFFGLLEASIENGSTKVLASPTLLLSESNLTDAGNDAGIGRKIGSEGIVEIGDQVPIDAVQGDGGACTYSYDTVGVKLGAKIISIDDNNYVTFTMTPTVTGLSGSFTVVGCGSVSKINKRRLDTGAIRIKDGETLVLTGVIQETDVDTLYKLPLLGDLPLLGSLFRSKTKTNDKRELIILVTPKVLDDDTSLNNNKFNLEFSDEDAKNLIENIQ